MAGALTIRLAAEADRESWERLWRGWQQHMAGTVPDDITERCWQTMMLPDSGLWAVLAFAEHQPLGFANVSRTPFAWTAEPVVFLQDLYVDPQARGRGIGSALLQGVYAHADAIGAPQVFWMVDEDDPELQAFYQRHAIRTPYNRYLRRNWPW